MLFKIYQGWVTGSLASTNCLAVLSIHSQSLRVVGPDVTKAFLDDNGLELLVRSHEVKDEGYEVAHNGRLVTVFSAPNYCDSMGNKGAFLRFNGSDMVPHFTTFSAVEHPDVKPMAYASSFLRGGI